MGHLQSNLNSMLDIYPERKIKTETNFERRVRDLPKFVVLEAM